MFYPLHPERLMEPEKIFHVLQIEDSLDDCADVKRMLLLGSNRHFKFTQAHTGAAGLAVMAELPEPPDCIFLDFSLPDMNALEIIEELKKGGALTPCPVVVLTGSVGGGQEVIRAGAQDYLGKSWATPQVITRAVENALERYVLANEHVAAMEKLRVSEEFNRTVLQSSPDCVKVIDREGVILLLNERGRDLFELDQEPSFYIGKKWADYWPPTHHAQLDEVLGKALAGKPSRFEQFGPTGKGNSKWWDVQVSPVFRPDGGIDRIVAVSRDITQSRIAQKNLEETSDWLSLGLQVSGVSLAQLDYDEGLAHLSMEAARLFGISHESATITRERLHETFHHEDEKELFHRIGGALDPASTGYFEMDHRVVWPDGQIKWLRVHKRVSFEGEGENRRPVRAILAALDITEKKLVEIKLADTAKRKDEFLAMLAHELRNPLAPLLTGMDLLVNLKDDPEMTAKIGGMMKRQVGQMAHLIDDLLDVSRITSGKIELEMTEVSLAEVLAQAVESVQPLIDKYKHTLNLNPVDPRVVIVADRHRLTQIISNLLSNAAKYTPSGGRIAVRVDGTQADTLSIAVEDNGHGISRDYQERIFELFDQGAAGHKEGLGVGLTLVKSLVEMHGGTIAVASEGPGHGSTFTLQLQRGVVATPVPEPDPVEISPPEAVRVLVADDSVSSADVMGLFFSMEGMNCDVAYDGEQAVSTALRTRPRIVFLDLGMPRLDGYEAARRIRAELPQTYIVALSGWGSEDDRRRTTEAGFNEHLVKPAKPDDLRRVVARATTL